MFLAGGSGRLNPVNDFRFFEKVRLKNRQIIIWGFKQQLAPETLKKASLCGSIEPKRFKPHGTN